jgi:hypothetical protein
MSKIKIKEIYNGCLVKIKGENFHFQYAEIAARFMEFYFKSSQEYSPSEAYDVFAANPSESTMKLMQELDAGRSSW